MNPRTWHPVLWVVIGVVALAAVFYGLNHRHPVPTEQGIVDAREGSAVAKAVTDPAAVKTGVRIDTVTRWLAAHPRVDTVWRVPTTRAETTAAVQQLPIAQGEANACREQLVTLRDDCADFRVKALARFASDSTTMTRQQAALDARRIPSRWSLCGGVGYGAQARSGMLTVGPTAMVGLCYRIF